MFEKTVFGVFLGFAMWLGASSAEAQTPSKPTVVATHVSATSIQLDWTAPATNSAGITAYHVRWRTAATDGPDGMSGTSDDVAAGTWQNASGDDADCASTATTPEDCGEELGVVLSYTVTGLTSGTRYEFQARAENASGVGTWSDAVELVAQVPVPGKPSVTVRGASGTFSVWNLRLAWAAVNSAGITAYHVRWRTAATDGPDGMSGTSDDVAAGTWQNASGDDADCASDATTPEDCGEELGSSARTYRVVGLVSRTFYEFQVRAENTSGVGAWSDSIELTFEMLGSSATLSALVVNDGANDVMLTPTFVADNGVTSYALSLRGGVSSIDVTPTTVENATFDVKKSGVSVGTSGTVTVSLEAVESIITVELTSENGVAMQTYTITVTRRASLTDASLSALELPSGVVLSPAFDSATLSYTAEVRGGRSNLDVTPVATDAAGASIAVGRSGFLVAATSGSASTQGIDKTAGTAAQDATENTFLIAVTAEDGTTTRTYQIAVSRLATRTDASLSALESPSGVVLSPAFASDTLSYTFDANNGWGSFVITPTATDAGGASIAVGRVGFLGGVASGSGSSQGITKTSGTAAQDATENTFLIVVTAEDGTTTRTYEIAVSRLAVSTDTTLSALELSPGIALSPAFDAATLSYTAEVRSSINNLHITPTGGDSRVRWSSIQVGRAGFLGTVVSGSSSRQGITKTSGTAAQDATENTFLVVVTAEDGTTTGTYEIAVSRLAIGTDATLSALTLSSGIALSPAFSSATLSYTTEVGTQLGRLGITPTATDAAVASIRVGRSSSLAAVGSGSPSIQDINKTAGTAAQDATNNTFLVVVTAEDGTTARTYQIAVSRLAVAANPSADASLRSLTITGGTLRPAFSANTGFYDLSVSSDTGTITFTPTPANARAVSVVGRSGSLSSNLVNGASSDQLVEVGGGAGSTANIFLIVVTAEDGTATATYTVNVFRASPITKILIHDSSVRVAARTDANSLLSTAAVPGGATAFDPTVQTYSLHVVRESVDEVVITPTFGSGTVEYQRTQPAPATALTAIASGAVSAPVALADGTNVIVIRFSSGGVTADYRITIARFDLDVDGGGVVAVDGILIARYLLGERGASLLSGQSGATAMTLEAAIKAGVDAQFLSAVANGILVARYVLGVRGARLTGGFSGLDATEEAAKILRLLPTP